MIVRALETNAWRAIWCVPAMRPTRSTRRRPLRGEAGDGGFARRCPRSCRSRTRDRPRGDQADGAGRAQVRAIQRCEGQHRSLGLKLHDGARGRRARFIPSVLTRSARRSSSTPTIRCVATIGMNGKTTGDVVRRRNRLLRALGRRCDGDRPLRPEQLRSAGTVTLHLRPRKRNRRTPKAVGCGAYLGASTMIICPAFHARQMTRSW